MCPFTMPRIDFCGFVVSAQGIEKQPEKIESITTWPVPKCTKDIRAFLGICGFYYRFIKNYAHIAAPLTELLKSTNPWTWGDPELASLNGLKHVMRDKVTMHFPNPQLEFPFQKPAPAENN